MKEKQFIFWQKWLTWVNVMIVGLGLVLAFAGNSIIFESYNDSNKKLFAEGPEFAENMLRMKNWLMGIVGGCIVGFHLLMIFISENSFKKKEKWAYYALWFGLLSWFCIDSGISLFYGAVHNVVMVNLVALVLIGLPLLVTFQAFHPKK